MTQIAVFLALRPTKNPSPCIERRTEREREDCGDNNRAERWSGLLPPVVLSSSKCGIITLLCQILPPHHLHHLHCNIYRGHRCTYGYDRGRGGRGGGGRGVINNSDDSRLCDLRTDNLVKLDDSQVYLL